MAFLVKQAEFLRTRVKYFVENVDRIKNINGNSRNINWSCRPKGCENGLVKTILGLITSAIATCGSIIYFLDNSLMASGLEAKLPNYPWTVNGIMASLDHASIRRGWQVYRNVCSTCHSIRFVRFQDLVDVSHTKSEVKAIAAEYEVEDGPDDEGNYYKRPGKLQDIVPSPFPNEEAARAANNGAYPVDLSFVINTKKSGRNYVFSLLTGYMDPPAGFGLSQGQVFNVYFPGGAISMPEIIQDGIVDYDDGTPATKSQIAKDIVEFLTWTGEQKWDERKVTLMRGVGVTAILLAMVAHMHNARWAVVKRAQIFFVPKKKC